MLVMFGTVGLIAILSGLPHPARSPMREAGTVASRALCMAIIVLACAAGSIGDVWAAGSRVPLLPKAQHNVSLLEKTAVFGKDDRVPLPPQHMQLKGKIGLLFNNRSRTVCTAFCVAKDIVATASHCLFRTRGQRRPSLANFWFARNYEKRQDYSRIFGHTRGATEQHVTAGDTRLSVRPPIGATRDWALLRLARPTCKNSILPIRPLNTLEVIREANAKRVFQVSYHRDFPNWRMAYSKPCAVARTFGRVAWSTIKKDFQSPGSLLLHQCDTGGASSGSPLLRMGPAGIEVVGMNVGTYVQSRVVMQNGRVTHRYKADTIANTAVTIVALHKRLRIFQASKILSASSQIRALQTHLKALKLYRGRVDGDYGPATRAAIVTYETKRKLPATGLATERLLKRLAADPQVAAGHPGGADPGSSPAD